MLFRSHHTFDFCRTARTKTEYKALLESPAVCPVDRAELRRQALMFYYMHNLYAAAAERQLVRAWGDFWRACNVGDVTEANVLECFRRLTELPAFTEFCRHLADSQ